MEDVGENPLVFKCREQRVNNLLYRPSREKEKALSRIRQLIIEHVKKKSSVIISAYIWDQISNSAFSLEKISFHYFRFVSQSRFNLTT